MIFPTAITLHGVGSPESLRTEVQARVQRLEQLLDDILACRVLIETGSRTPQKDCHYGAYVQVTLPCIEIEAGGKALSDAGHADPYLTVAETFDELTHRIEGFVRRRCSTCARYAKPQSGT